ncbi:MAG: hypothetical protein EPO20_02960 [Betaproteobacteria bacterium]|nr:MAG: hypothetical protein EPO20_02960 [Betaproteobacteria bacterium]
MLPVLGRLAPVFLAFALLAGWQGALLHPLQHLDEHGAFVHLADGHAGDQKSGKSGKSALCDALAALAACVAGAPLALVCVDCSQQPLSSHRSEPRAAQPPPFLAQGPPALL